MFGAVFGHTSDVAPGYEVSLTWKRLNLSSQAEYVANPGNRANNFFYNWDKIVYFPRDWFHAGFALQQTRAYHAPVDLQPGASFGIVRGRWDFTTCAFDVGLGSPSVAPGLAYSF
jgi:hypothetical protein